MFQDKRAKPWERKGGVTPKFSEHYCAIASLEDDFKGHPLELPHVIISPDAISGFVDCFEYTDILEKIKTVCRRNRLSMVNFGLNADAAIVVSFREGKHAATFKLFWVNGEA